MGPPLSAGLIGMIALSLICPYKLQGQCGTAPVAFNPYSFKIGDSHTYNPYSSKDSDVANINHEPKCLVRRAIGYRRHITLAAVRTRASLNKLMSPR